MVPVTVEMLRQTRNELVARIDASEKTLSAEIKLQIHGVRSEFNGLRSEFDGMRAELHEVRADVARIVVLVEEQNARNAVVLEGLTNLWHRQSHQEKRTDDLEGMVRSLVATAKR